MSEELKKLLALGDAPLTDDEQAKRLVRCLEMHNEACQLAPPTHPMGQMIVIGLAGLADALHTYVAMVKAEIKRQQERDDD